jgi:hypothetical protein
MRMQQVYDDRVPITTPITTQSRVRPSAWARAVLEKSEAPRRDRSQPARRGLVTVVMVDRQSSGIRPVTMRSRIARNSRA